MIWQYLRQKQLQEAIGEQNFDRFETLFPVLLDADSDPTDLYKKANLAKLFSAFASGGLFKNKQFVRMILNQLPPDKLEELCTFVGVGQSMESFEERVDCLVRKGWTDDEFCKKFLVWAELPDYFMPAKPAMQLREELVECELVAYKILKDYQFGAYTDCLKELEKERSRFVLQMPTGSGKTRTIMEVIAQYLNQMEAGTMVVWLAHSQELCDQSLACFKEVWRHVGHHQVRVVASWGSNSMLPYESSERSFVVASFQGLYSLLKKDKISFRESKDRIALVIVDEAHKVIAPTYKEVTKALLGSRTHVIGLTATPGRSASELDENKELSDFFFNTIISLTPPKHESVIGWLQSKGVLSQHSFEPLITNRTFELTPKQATYLETLYDFPSGFLSEVGSDDVRNLEIVRRLERELKLGASILFFACSVEHSKFISSVLMYMGYFVAHIDGNTDSALRKRHIDGFRSGDVQVICNFGVLSTGFDAPKTDVVFISRPTASIVLYSQMLGRGLRGPAIGGTEECKIIDVRDNIIGFSDQDALYEYFDEYWQ